MSEVYVNMTDKFMSGWGLARGGRSHYCIRCESWAQARAIEKAAMARDEMKRVTVAEKPRRGRAGDHVSIKHVSDLGGPWLAYMPAGEMPAGADQ